MYKLICDQDPKVLGILDAEGNWDMTVFRKHIEHCAVCKQFVSALASDMGEIFELPRWHCERCGWDWIPRREERPNVCPHCHSPYWDKGKKKSKK